MPPGRQFGAEISGNRRRRPYLTPDQRLQIIAKASAGVSTEELVKEFDRDPTTIRRVARSATTRTTTTRARGRGRPPILSRHQKKLVHQALRKNPKIQYKELQEVAQIALPDSTLTPAPSRSTLYRVIKQTGIIHRPCRKRPKLTRSRALRRWR
jgi:transposase